MSYLKTGESMFETLDVKVHWTYLNQKHGREYTGILNFEKEEVKGKDMPEIRDEAIKELGKHCKMSDALISKVEIMTWKDVNGW